MDDVLVLIAQELETDSRGVQRKTEETRREIFCQVKSVTRSEYYNAGQSGFSPEFLFTIFPAEYREEKTVEYRGERYAVYRTYRKNADTLELYVRSEAGVHNVHDL